MPTSKPTNIRDLLWADHGPIMDAKAVCKLLHYPSLDALQAAKGRGKLPFKALVIEGRRGIFASTEEIADILDRATSGTTVVAAGGRDVQTPSVQVDRPKESHMK